VRLGRKQGIFARHFAILVTVANARPGYSVRIDQVARSNEEAKRLGFENSLHCKRLAGDLLLFRDNRYLTKTKDYAWLGAIWKCFTGMYDGELLEFCWGGEFGDGNHFSIRHGRRR
jgi:hypothetical protein